MKSEATASWQESCDKPRQCIEKQRCKVSADKGLYSQGLFMVFPVVMYGCESWTVKKTEHKELMPSNCGAGEDFWKSLGQQGDQTSQS